MSLRAEATQVRPIGYMWSETAAFAALGCALLLLRLALPAAASRPWTLAAIYVALGGAGVLSWVEPRIVGERATGSLRLAPVLVVGIAAVIAAGRLSGPPLPSDTPLPVLAMGLNSLAAVAEEAFFRRALYGKLIRYGAPVAIGITAVLFGLVHVPVYGIAAIWVDVGAGLLLSWQRWASGTWTVPAATHVAANLLAVIR